MFHSPFTYLAIAIVIALVALLVGTPVADLSQKEQVCIQKMERAVENFFVAQEKFRDSFAPTWKIVAQNDLMCSDPEWMGNAVIVIEELGKRQGEIEAAWYGIFHLHFLRDGTLRSAASINDTVWTKLVAPNDWKSDWCGLLKTVYPEDFKRECTSTPNTAP